MSNKSPIYDKFSIIKKGKKIISIYPMQIENSFIEYRNEDLIAWDILLDFKGRLFQV